MEIDFQPYSPAVFSSVQMPDRIARFRLLDCDEFFIVYERRPPNVSTSSQTGYCVTQSERHQWVSTRRWNSGITQKITPWNQISMCYRCGIHGISRTKIEQRQSKLTSKLTLSYCFRNQSRESHSSMIQHRNVL